MPRLTRMQAIAKARQLADGDPEALAELRDALLFSKGRAGMAAKLIGFRGASTLYRIRERSTCVRALMQQYVRSPGRPPRG